MIAKAEEIKERTMQRFDSDVRELSQIDYRELLEELSSDFEARLQCVKDELADEGEDTE